MYQAATPRHFANALRSRRGDRSSFDRLIDTGTGELLSPVPVYVPKTAIIYGRGGGVGRGRGVGAGLGVGVGLGVDVAVAVGVAVTVAVAVAVAVGVGEGDPQGLTGQLKISIEAIIVTPSSA